VDGLLKGFDSVEDSMSGLSDKLQDSMDAIDEFNDNLTKVSRGNGRIMSTGMELNSKPFIKSQRSRFPSVSMMPRYRKPI